VRKTDDLATILCRCQENLGTLTSWIPLGHSKPVMGQLYLYGARLLMMDRETLRNM
jgi:hypothetical protein